MEMILKAGDNFEVAYQVTEKIYQGFIDTFNDRNPLHTDEKFAKERNFAGKVMHGAILVGFLSNFIGERLPLKNVIIMSYSILFSRPVYLGDNLTLYATIADISPAVNCADIKYEFKNSGNVAVSKGKISIKII